MGRDHRRFEPEVSWDELERLGVRLRLVELELTDHERFRYEDQAQRELSIGSLELACPEPEEAERVATAVLGAAGSARLRFLPGADRPELRAWQLAGEAVSSEEALGALIQ